MLSSAEENYIKAIFKISDKKGIPVSTNSIADELETTAASVTDMIQKLSDKNLVFYEKYKGVSLSSDGKTQATRLLRKHRLWECFLVDKLGFPWDEVHDIAEQLEHVQSDKLIDRLAEFLDHPKFDPHGDPIPDSGGRFTLRQQTKLSELSPGHSCLVVGVSEHSSTYLQYLADIGIQIGASINILDMYPYDGALKIKIENEAPQIISKQVAQNMIVKESRNE